MLGGRAGVTAATTQRRRIGRLSPSGRSLLLIALAATLFGTEGLLRRPLLDSMSVASIVLAEYLLLAVFAAPVVIAQRHILARLSWRNWCVLLVIGAGSSGGGALLFTKALEVGSPTTASLLQNTQPLFVVFLAVLFLKERLERLYWPCLAVSIAGAYLLSFGTSGAAVTLNRNEAIAAGLALAAAALWACGTVLARVVLSEMSCVVLTAVRILFALPFVALVGIPQGALHGSVSGILAHPAQLGASALAPGLLAMLLFYRGLRGSKASHAVLAEFMYPVAALVGNWIVLGTLITPLQGFGCLLLIGTIFVLSWKPTSNAAPQLAHVDVGANEAGFAFAESA